MANTIIRGSGTDAIINRKRKNTSNDVSINNSGINPLTNPAMKAENAIKTPGFTGDITPAAEQYKQNKANTIQYIRDMDTGKVTGVDLSNLGGGVHSNIPMSQISALVNKFTGERMISPNVAFADQKPIVPITREEQLLQDFQQKQADAELIKSQVPLMTPQQIEQGTNPSNQELNNPLTQNIQERTQLGLMTSRIAGLTWTNFSPQLTRLLNREGEGVGSGLQSQANNVNTIKDYFNNYSNEDNYNLVHQHITDAKTAANDAITIAAEPGRQDEALEVYRAAIKRLRIADSQLKQLNNNKGYDAKVNLDRDDLESYFRDLPNKDNDLAFALRRGKLGVQ